MIKAVYDTNVIISGFVSPEGIPASLNNLATQGLIRLFLSKEILEEYEEVLLRPEFNLSQRKVKRFLYKLREKGKVVKPRTTVKVLEDPSDNKFLECAISGKVEYLVTGDTSHFSLSNFQGVKIVSPREFWEIYKDNLLTSIR